MLKQYRKSLILSSLVTLLPIVVGLLLWERLPDIMTTHWGIDGQADGWGSVPFAVFIPPLIMLAVQWLCVCITAADPGNQNRNKKMQALVLWIIPILSNMCCGMMYALALGVEFSPVAWTLAFLGILFAILGNYMPKTRMNGTMGIKVPWAYTSQENWNATHRFGGKVWVIGGIAMAFSGFLPETLAVTVMLCSILILCVVPIVYSYLFYRKQKANGDTLTPLPPLVTKANKFTLVFLIFLMVFVLVILFSGNIHLVYSETGFTIEASFYDDLTVDYDAIESVEYRGGNVSGIRVGGYGSFRLLMGYFRNEEFGTYTRYTYYNPDACIVLTVGGKTLVLSGRDASETKAIYEYLQSKIK